jgi:hypothetical protein
MARAVRFKPILLTRLTRARLRLTDPITRKKQ